MEESKNTFSRRQFVELLGVSAAGFGLVSMAGCSGGDTSAPADPRALDPAYFDDGESAVVSCNIHEGLYQYSAKDAKVAPCLAVDLPEISDDGKVYTIKLREGVKFHDGAEFNAEAVKKSIERQLEPNRNSDMPYASFVFGEKEAGNGVETVEAVDPTTVKITLRAASTPFLKNLAMALASPIVSPAAIDAATPGQPIAEPKGTGPYKFVDWTKGASVTLVANDEYWGEAPRKAVAQAINVEEMVQAIYGDYATVANSVMPTWMAPYAKDVKQTAYDPEAAKKTLADKGITSLQCITYTTARPYNQKGGSQLANMIQGYLSEVGVDVSITEYDWTTYKTKVQTDPYDICFYGWTGDNGDPDNFMNLLADTNWSMNVAHFQDDEYKALIAQGVDTPDGDERDAIYLKCEEMVAEKQPWVLISHSKNLLGINPKVKDFYYHPTGVAFFKGVSKEA